MHIGPRTFVELTAGGRDDPDGRRAGALLSAYFYAEYARSLRRLLWPRLGMLAGLWLILSLTSLFSRVTVATGFCIFAAIGLSAAFVEWTAEKRLKVLMGELPRGARAVTSATRTAV